MNETPSSRRWPWRAAGIAAVTLFIVLVARYWHPVYGFTAFLQLDSSCDPTKIAAFREHPVYVYRNTGGYDGLYYAQIAYHPLLDAPELAPAIDSLAYRARRILPSALAWILAAGNPGAIVHVYSVLNIVAWLALAALLWRLLEVNSVRGFLAWAGVMFSAGALSSVRNALTDLIALAILAAGLLALERGRIRGAIGALAAAGLARETSLAALPGWWDRPWFSLKNLFRSLVVVLPLVAWIAYVRWRVGANSGLDNFTWPLLGFLEKWSSSLRALNGTDDALIVWATVLATLALAAQAIFFFTRWRTDDRWWRIGFIYAVVMFWLGGAVWAGLPGAATRVLLPLSLAFNIMVHRTRASVAWLVAGNLTVIAGALAILNVHEDPRELAAARGHGTAVVATLGDGWYGREHSSRHTWSWCGDKGVVTLETWPKISGRVQLEFSARGIAPSNLTARAEGKILWSGPVGTKRGEPQHMAIAFTNGRAIVEFSSDTAAVQAGTNGDPRALAFALYDARIVVTEP